jgi:outer membrane protein
MIRHKRFRDGGTAFVLLCGLFFMVSPHCLSAEEKAHAAQVNSAEEKSDEAVLSIQTMTASEQKTPALIRYTLVSGHQDKSNRTGEGMIAQNETLTLNRCIEIALTKNPGIVAAMNAVDVSRSRVGEARSAYYPQISAVGGYNRTKNVSETSSTVLSTGTSTTTTSPATNFYSGSITLNQNILDFGRTSSSVDATKYTLESSRSDLASTENSVILNVKEAYYGVLQAKRNRDVAADVLKQFELHLDQAKGFYEVGTKAKIDVIKAEVDLSNAKLSLIHAENALKIAWVTLNNAMGVPDAPEYAIEDNLSFTQYAVTLEDAITKAFENRPDLKSIIARRQAAEANISFARSNYFPVLSGNASYTRSETDLPDNTVNANTWGVGLTLTIPLFSGFLTSHQVAEAKSALYVLKANEESIRQQILLEVRQAYLNLQAAEASIATAELASQQAKENLDLANGRYSAGVGSPIEVSDAFATYVSAQANYTSALADYKIAQASIEQAIGARQ